ncbi:MAG: type III PLP-dependent enzyme [Candidatus Margulisiibacteriota bacterium]
MLTKSQIDKLIKEHGAPLLVIKRQQLIDAYTKMRELLPRVGIYYAVKSNPHPEIVKTFAELGSSFEVASGTEIDEILSLGIGPDRILFANPVKKIADLENARRVGVDITTFDNTAELDKIAEHLPRSRVVLRLKVPNIDSMVNLSLKFGAEPADAMPLMLKAREKGLIPTGVSFHVGSQCLNTVNYGRAIELSACVFSECNKAGINLSLLDIGGGFPIKYLPQVNVPSINDIARKINHSLAKHFPDKRVKVIAEPGRYLCGEAVTLITSVIGCATRNGKRWYTMDDGIYGTFSGIMFDHAKYQFNAHKGEDGQLFASVLAGPSCDSLDVIADDLYLPELSPGDILITPSIGAYSSAHATKFNGIPLTKSVVID